MYLRSRSTQQCLHRQNCRKSALTGPGTLEGVPFSKSAVDLIEDGPFAPAPFGRDKEPAGNVSGETVDRDIRRDDLKTADNQVNVFINRIKRNIVRHRFVKRRCLYYIHQMEFETENTSAAYVTDGIEHHFTVFSRKPQDKMCNDADPARIKLGRSSVVSADRIAGIHRLKRAVVCTLEPELDPKEVFFVYLLKQVKNIFT